MQLPNYYNSRELQQFKRVSVVQRAEPHEWAAARAAAEAEATEPHHTLSLLLARGATGALG